MTGDDRPAAPGADPRERRPAPTIGPGTESPGTESPDTESPSTESPGTEANSYAERLVRLQTKSWKTRLDVQRPYRWNISRMRLGRTLDVGCGIGRNLRGLPAGSLGVDHNERAVDVARSAGYAAMTVTEFRASEHAGSAAFDGMLLAHVLEHMPSAAAGALLQEYLPALRPGAHIAMICPQERGQASDPTHVRFLGVTELTELAQAAGLEVLRSWSFPLPRSFGRLFIYNETCLLARLPA